MESKNLNVEITVYGGFLVISTINSNGMILPGGGNMGTTLANAKGKVGASKEAIEAICGARKDGGFSQGLDCYGTEENAIFQWFGGQNRLIELSDVEASRDHDPSLFRKIVVEIENNVPEGAKEAIDAA